MLTMLARLLKVLNSEADPFQISLALSFSMIFGLTPLFSLHNLVVLLLVLLLRVNLSGFILGGLFFSGIAYLLDPLFHRIGLALLTADALQHLWTTLYNTTLFRLAHFNNSVLLGSLAASIVLFLPALFLFNAAIRNYRTHLVGWIQKTRLGQMVQASKIYNIYRTVSGFGGIS